MIIHGDTYISDDVIEKRFVCDLFKCKGACCVEGDLGAPLEEDELLLLEDNYEAIKPYMSEKGKLEVEKQGLFILDEEGDFSTTTINDRECVYAVYDQNKILKCSIEQAYREGKSTFRKPISCYLYPIRISKLKNGVALNYDKWEICKPACSNGEALKVEVYKFLKTPLIDRFGEEWYKDLEEIAEQYVKMKKEEKAD